MKETISIPFLEGLNRRSGSLRIQLFVLKNTDNKLLSLLFFYICLPWVIFYSFFEYIIGSINSYRKKMQCNAKYKLSVVAIAKNESEYIEEWIAFHMASGVDHIYIYDNDSTDNMLEKIKKYINMGFVTYNQIHGERQQGNAYNDALNRYGIDSKYIAFIDCDEYLQTVDNSKTIADELDRLLYGHKKRAGVVVNWVMYGSSNYEKKPDGFCFEAFTMRAKPGKKGTFVIKTIVRPECVKSYNHPHMPEYYTGFYSVNTSGDRCDLWYNPIQEYHSLRLNHYFVKSKEQWIIRRKGKRADTGTIRTLEEFYQHDNNDVIDKSPIVYLERVKEIILNNKNNQKKDE